MGELLRDAMRADGIPAKTCRPDIVVSHRMHYSLGLYLSTALLLTVVLLRTAPKARALQGRFYSCCRRWLFRRSCSSGPSREDHQAAVSGSAGLVVAILVFVVAWAAGVAWGHLRGSGNSLSKVR